MKKAAFGNWLRRRAGLLIGAVGVMIVLPGCSALNPAFVDLFDPTGGFEATIDNPPGHVAIAFVNDADVDERLIAFLESEEGGGLELTEAERRALKPRIRFRVQVDFVNGNSTLFEFVTGSKILVDPRFDATSVPDLVENDLENTVVLCDVARVQIVGNIEVFFPAQFATWAFQEATVNTGGFFFIQGTPAPPQFIPLRVDAVDQDGNTLVRRNIGIRDVPVPVDGPRCGSVVSFVVSGTLSSPFFRGIPGFSLLDTGVAERLGGRYEIRTRIN